MGCAGTQRPKSSCAWTLNSTCSVRLAHSCRGSSQSGNSLRTNLPMRVTAASCSHGGTRPNPNGGSTPSSTCTWCTETCQHVICPSGRSSARVRIALLHLRQELEWVCKQPQGRQAKSKSRVDAFFNLKLKYLYSPCQISSPTCSFACIQIIGTWQLERELEWNVQAAAGASGQVQNTRGRLLQLEVGLHRICQLHSSVSFCFHCARACCLLVLGS